jgi:hypothetical protein
MAILYGIRLIRWIPLLDGGCEDASATAIDSTNIQSMDITPVYVDGLESTQRGGDDIVAIVKEEDTYRGCDLTLSLAQFEGTLKAAIVGGTSDSDDQWSAPIDDTEMPYPGRLEVWVANYTESDSESTQDGFILYTFNYCIGRLGSSGPADQAFTNEQFVIRARRNDCDPSDIKPAVEMEIDDTEVPGAV